MGHLQTVEAKLRDLIHAGDEEALVRFVKEAVLQSYRNGLALRQHAGAEGQKFERRYAKKRRAD